MFLFWQLSIKSSVPASYESATPTFHREPTRSLQLYEEVVEGQAVEDVVGRPLPHLSSIKQATGEATYVDDLQPYKGMFVSMQFCVSGPHFEVVTLAVTSVY